MISREKAEAIRALADENGYIEPADLVAAARNRTHPLHEDFPWDLNVAAQQCWLDIARRLIRFVKLEITIDHRTITSVAYVADPDRPHKSRRYVDLTVAAQRKHVAQQILLDEMARIVSQVKRAREVCTVLGLSAQLDSLLDDIRGVVDAAERATAPKVRKRATTTSARKRARAEARV